MNIGSTFAAGGRNAWAESMLGGHDAPPRRSQPQSRKGAISPAEVEKTSELVSAVRDLMAVHRAALARAKAGPSEPDC